MKSPALIPPALLILALASVATSVPATAAPQSGVPTAARAADSPTATEVRAPHRHGGRIVWVNASTLDDVDVTGNLLIADANGSHQRELTTKVDGVNDADPSFSPDGRLVAWARNANDTADIYVIRASGGGERHLNLGCSGNCLGDDKPTWISPHRIAFTHFVEDAAYPDGYAGILVAANLDGSHVRQLTPSRDDGKYEDAYARLSSNGRYFVFNRYDIVNDRVAVFRIQRNGTHARQLTPWDLEAQLPHLSPATHGPTKNLVVFQTYGEGNPTGSSRDLATVPSTCKSLEACTAAIAFVTHNGFGTGRASNPAWSPTGRKIVYAGRPNAETVDVQITTIRYDGTHPHEVSTSPGFDYRPDWGRWAG